MHRGVFFSCMMGSELKSYSKCRKFVLLLVVLTGTTHNVSKQRGRQNGPLASLCSGGALNTIIDSFFLGFFMKVPCL